MLLGCFAAWNNGFQKNFLIRFNERHEVCVTFDQNDRNLLARITILIGMVIDIHLISELDIQDHLLKRNASLFHEQIVLLRIPSIDFHNQRLAKRVPFVIMKRPGKNRPDFGFLTKGSCVPCRHNALL